MGSHFPHRDPDEAAAFALGYFARLQSDPDILLFPFYSINTTSSTE
jgi:hypothetical protein